MQLLPAQELVGIFLIGLLTLLVIDFLGHKPVSLRLTLMNVLWACIAVAIVQVLSWISHTTNWFNF
jgi:Na+/H+ antiporter NhaD/arsenite permease-like protein